MLEAAIRTRSRELFLMTTLGLCFAIALLTSSVGLSLSLGAFLAGLIMSESEYSHSALEGVLPFRDVFTSIFSFPSACFSIRLLSWRICLRFWGWPGRFLSSRLFGRAGRTVARLSMACGHSRRTLPVSDRRVLLCAGGSGHGQQIAQPHGISVLSCGRHLDHGGDAISHRGCSGHIRASGETHASGAQSRAAQGGAGGPA